MKPIRALAITKRIFKSLRHDPRTIAMILIAPIMAMIIFGIAFSGEVHDVNVVIVNQDLGFSDGGFNKSISISDRIIDNLDREKVRLRFENDPDKALDLVKSGKYNTMVIFPENFTSEVIGSLTDHANTTGRGELIIRSDRSQVNVASEVRMTFNQAILDTMHDMGFDSPVNVVEQPVYGKDARFIDMFVPGIMGFVVFLLTTILTLVSFVGERTRMTLERLLASSVTEGEIVIGYATAFSIIGMAQVGILLVLAIFLFDIIVEGNPLIAFLIASILASVSVCLGILLSSLAKRESQAVQFFPLVILPVFLLSGVFWPLEAMPKWLRPFSYLVPVTYAVEGLRSVLIRGWGILQIWLDIVALLGFAAVFLFGAILSLKRTRRG